jgi:dTMP kinase
MPGLFVTFEGGEGSGKSTQVELLAARLRAAGHDPLLTREPGGTPLAEGIRALLMDPAHRPVPVAEALLMEASRAQLVTTVLQPALATGRVVVCDRYADSTLAYQGAGRGLDPAMLERLNAIATGGLAPDLTLLFDLPVEEGLARRHGAGGTITRLDREAADFHSRVRACFQTLAAADPGRWVTLDARASREDLAEQVWARVQPRLGTAGL